jgi:hypothetical protein
LRHAGEYGMELLFLLRNPAGRAPQDAPVTVKGWVRTRRDSKGRHLVRPPFRRLVVPPRAGRGAERACELRRRSAAPDGRLRGRSNRSIVRRPPRGSRSRCRRRACACSAGSTTRTRTRSSPSPTRSNSCAKSRTCGRAPT